MATAVARLQRFGRVHSEVPVNLLPQEILARQRTRRALTGASIGAGALVFLLIALTFLQHQAISSANNDLAAQRTIATTLEGQVGSLAQFGVMEARIAGTRTTLASALRSDVTWSRFMTDLALNIPSDSWLTNVTVAAATAPAPDGTTQLGTVTYAGSVLTFPGLSNWLTTMSRLKGLHFVYLGNGSKPSGVGPQIVTFTASAFITPAMLSGRCQTSSAPCP